MRLLIQSSYIDPVKDFLGVDVLLVGLEESSQLVGDVGLVLVANRAPRRWEHGGQSRTRLSELQFLKNEKNMVKRKGLIFPLKKGLFFLRRCSNLLWCHLWILSGRHSSGET